MALSSVSIIPFYMIYLYFATPGNTMQVSICVCLCFRLIADFVILCVISFQRQNKSKKRIAFGNKEHTELRNAETRFDRVSSYATL